MQLKGLGDAIYDQMIAEQNAGLVDASAAPVDTGVSAGSSLDWSGMLKAIAQPAADVAKTYFTAEAAKAAAPYQYGGAYPRYTAAGQPIRYSATGQPIGVGYPTGQLPGTFSTTPMMPILLLGGAALIAFMIFSKG